ncbi:hypothetical protein [Filibacter tadaridae]|uniref:hypothetical protein n=1 Tax=Filibacter tadaridae TaxID=2483811 RepID=UPI000F51E1B2|nr:hypothetical protein [Filibacter tadaridae]
MYIQVLRIAPISIHTAVVNSALVMCKDMAKAFLSMSIICVRSLTGKIVPVIAIGTNEMDG